MRFRSYRFTRFVGPMARAGPGTRGRGRGRGMPGRSGRPWMSPLPRVRGDLKISVWRRGPGPGSGPAAPSATHRRTAGTFNPLRFLYDRWIVVACVAEPCLALPLHFFPHTKAIQLHFHLPAETGIRSRRKTRGPWPCSLGPQRAWPAHSWDSRRARLPLRCASGQSPRARPPRSLRSPPTADPDAAA